MLLIASPVTRGLAIGGTLMVGTGCGAPTVDECVQYRDECLAACPEGSGDECLLRCGDEYDLCLSDAYAAEENRDADAAAIAEAGVACLAVLACTVESLGDGDGDGDEGEDDWSEPEADDWGQDWGEQTPDEELELISTPRDWSDLPHDE